MIFLNYKGDDGEDSKRYNDIDSARKAMEEAYHLTVRNCRVPPDPLCGSIAKEDYIVYNYTDGSGTRLHTHTWAIEDLTQYLLVWNDGVILRHEQFPEKEAAVKEMHAMYDNKLKQLTSTATPDQIRQYSTRRTDERCYIYTPYGISTYAVIPV